MNKLIPFLAGALFLIIGGFALKTTVDEYLFMQKFATNSTQVEALITESIKKVSSDSDGNESISYLNYVEYIIDYTTYYSTFSSSLRYNTNTSIDIYYYNEDYNIIRTSTNNSITGILFTLIFPLVGIILIIGPLFPMVRNQNLKRKGDKIHATITNYDIDYNVRVNNQYSMKILSCEYYDSKDGKTYKFSKRGIPDIEGFDTLEPEKIIGRKVLVYVSKKKKSKYFVDYNNII